MGKRTVEVDPIVYCPDRKSRGPSDDISSSRTGRSPVTTAFIFVLLATLLAPVSSESGGRMISASCPPSVVMRTPPSIGGVDVGVRIPLFGYGLRRLLLLWARRQRQGPWRFPPLCVRRRSKSWIRQNRS